MIEQRPMMDIVLAEELHFTSVAYGRPSDWGTGIFAPGRRILSLQTKSVSLSGLPHRARYWLFSKFLGSNATPR
jgi:hypothetical protein